MEAKWCQWPRPGAVPASCLRAQLKAVQIHHLVPRSDKVTHKLLLRVVAGIDLNDRSELRIRTEDEVHGGAGPLDLTRSAVTPLVDAFVFGGLLPLRVHVEQVHEEVGGQ